MAALPPSGSLHGASDLKEYVEGEREREMREGGNGGREEVSLLLVKPLPGRDQVTQNIHHPAGLSKAELICGQG